MVRPPFLPRSINIVIASEAKQSRELRALTTLDRCVASLLAMTALASQPITELLSVARIEATPGLKLF
jgi:hypothetical protein